MWVQVPPPAPEVKNECKSQKGLSDLETCPTAGGEEGFNRYGFFKSKRRHKKRKVSFTPTVANYAGEIWSIDFIHDSLENGRAFRVFNVIDVYSRKAFEPVVDFSTLTPQSFRE